MKIAIIGAGFTGLSAAYQLQKQGHDVTIFEKDSEPGGLAIGYKEKEWEWSLEKHYHHWFTNDSAVLNLAKEIEFPVVIKRPHTNWYVDGKIYAYDSPLAILKFPALSFTDNLRNLFTLGMLRVNPFWKPLEKINATIFLPKVMGKRGYQTLLEPLFVNKFGHYANDVSLAWFWARIKKRTPSLAYPQGGFLTFANYLVKKLEEKGTKVLFNTEVQEILSIKNGVKIKSKRIGNWKLEIGNYDAVVVTVPTFLFLQTTPQLPEAYKKSLKRLHSLGATNLVLRLKRPFFKDNTYWLSIADKNSPIMAIVEHTNFMDKKHYNNEHIVYLGNYLLPTDPRYLMNKEEKLNLFTPYLEKINPSFRKDVIGYDLFKAPFAQPVIPTNYSQYIPPFTTPLKNVFLANIDQVYPWDRGTNYAVELGEKIAKIIHES